MNHPQNDVSSAGKSRGGPNGPGDNVKLSFFAMAGIGVFGTVILLLVLWTQTRFR